MNNFKLDFEQPLVELQSKIDQMIEFSKENNLEMKDGITALMQEMNEKKKQIFNNLTPWQKVSLARHPNRPYSLDYIERIFTDFIELKGDRAFGNDQALIGGFAKLNNKKVMIIAQQKGRNLEERSSRNFGMSHPEGYRKALRLMKLADKTNTPIITFIDTPGAFPGVASEERHIGEAIAINLKDMFNIASPIIAIVIGEGGSGGALGIGIGNKVLILENAYYSVISPEGCAGIIWDDPTKAEDAALAMKISSTHLKDLNIVDEIIAEPLGGAHEDYDITSTNIKNSLLSSLEQLNQLNQAELKEQRYHRFRILGKTKS